MQSFYSEWLYERDKQYPQNKTIKHVEISTYYPQTQSFVPYKDSHTEGKCIFSFACIVAGKVKLHLNDDHRINKQI